MKAVKLVSKKGKLAPAKKTATKAQTPWAKGFGSAPAMTMKKWRKMWE